LIVVDNALLHELLHLQVEDVETEEQGGEE
jgi:hypothetical protein